MILVFIGISEVTYSKVLWLKYAHAKANLWKNSIVLVVTHLSFLLSPPLHSPFLFKGPKHVTSILQRYLLQCYFYKAENTYQLTTCNRFFVEKLVVAQIVMKFPFFYRIWNFIIVYTTALHRIISGARWIQSDFLNPTSLMLILLLSWHFLSNLMNNLFLWGFPAKIRNTRISHLFNAFYCPIQLILSEWLKLIYLKNAGQAVA
jgi:hypothetical protein